MQASQEITRRTEMERLQFASRIMPGLEQDGSGESLASDSGGSVPTAVAAVGSTTTTTTSTQGQSQPQQQQPQPRLQQQQQQQQNQTTTAVPTAATLGPLPAGWGEFHPTFSFFNSLPVLLVHSFVFRL